MASTGAQSGHLLRDWRPEDPAFWAETGRKIANRNLWISIPALLLSFCVWMVWSVVVNKLPAIGFDYSTEALFWLAALPGLSGATLRIFYSFMIPIFGGRLWTTLSTASLLLPALGIGFAVQNSDTPYAVFLILALLCGFGGGNFASSMANIAYFFPRNQKGNALALNAGLGNLGVSVMQFLVPLAITAGVFGALGGEPQTLDEGGRGEEPGARLHPGDRTPPPGRDRGRGHRLFPIGSREGRTNGSDETEAPERRQGLLSLGAHAAPHAERPVRRHLDPPRVAPGRHGAHGRRGSPASRRHPGVGRRQHRQ